MRQPLYIFLITVITITLAACSGSSTGPDSDNEPNNYTLSVDMTPSDAGTISPSTEETYEEGEEIELQADPNEEYVFTGWSGDIESPDNPLSVTVDQDYEITANFELKTYELAILTEGEGSVQEEILEQPSKEYEHGTVIELTANAAEGYRFVEWQGDVTGSDNPAEITVNDPKEVTAVFEKKTYPLTVNTDGDGAVSEEVIQQKATDYEYGTVVELTANPANGSEFKEWTGDVTGTNNPLEVTVEDTLEITAVFDKKTYTILTSTTGEGTLSFDPDQDNYEHGTTVEVSAAPETGWEFVEWIDDVEGTENPTEITMDGSKEVTAIFEEVQENKFYLHENGVTIMCPDALLRETGEVNGVEYEAVNRNMINLRILNSADLTTACTSLITDMSELFDGNSALDQDLGNWDVSNVTDMHAMFRGALSFNADLSHWDVSNVTDMSAMFDNAKDFIGNIGNWNVSSVTDMSNMFSYASEFIGDLSNWNVGSVANMSEMFSGAVSFNGDLSNWNVGNVTTMYGMFDSAESFNSDLNSWDVGNVINMSFMFAHAKIFNGNISSWDVSNVTNMRRMFNVTTDFNQDISNWDVGNVTDMYAMFYNAPSFNQNLNSWNVGNVTTMRHMFHHATNFNSDISSWDVSSVTDMQAMFTYNSFNGDLSSWDVSSVTDMSSMFSSNEIFNGDIGNWNVGNVTNMEDMFRFAKSFNQDIGDWDVSSIPDRFAMESMFWNAESFIQDLSGWCVANISSSAPPSSFDGNSGFEDNDALQPQWGTCPQ